MTREEKLKKISQHILEREIKPTVLGSVITKEWLDLWPWYIFRVKLETKKEGKYKRYQVNVKTKIEELIDGAYAILNHYWYLKK